MAFDTPRGTTTPRTLDTPQADATAPPPGWDHLRQARTRLLALSADLDDLGVKSRLVDSDSRSGSSPMVLRCWKPHMMSRVREVGCVPGGHGRSWEFQHLLPAGRAIGDATNALNPGQATEAARVVKADLEVST
ncbi:hypothetical protein [Actinomadura sp. 3N508]|uniref:hypothetical protein n=1 Tax=Actinomadura sp. 3N508 TaxID=3375153 RepID=UPI0037905898